MKNPVTLLDHIEEMDKYFQSMNSVQPDDNFRASIPLSEWKALKSAALAEMIQVDQWVPPPPVLFPFDKKSNPDKFASYTVGQLWNAYLDGKNEGLRANRGTKNESTSQGN